MSEVSPKVASESPVLRVPMFVNKALFTSCRSLPSISAASSLASIASTSCSSLAVQGRSLSLDSFANCKCPHVLVADDDAFQKFYYLSLFQRSIDFSGLNIEKQSFRVKVVKSGEELLAKYSKSQTCGCGTLMLIITDYNMGLENINGVEVAEGLRKLGCKGTVFLRTSESREDLAINHQNLDKTVNFVLGKGNHSETKNKIQEVLKEKVSK